jgi:hypothetical protein
MTQDNEAYWDSLGIAWTAIAPDPKVVGPNLRWRLRWQMACTAVALFGGTLLGVAGIGLGVWTIWIGISAVAWNFVVRGAAIVVVSALIVSGAWSFRSALRGDSESLSNMMELALQRAEKWHRAARLGYLACGVAAILGILGYWIRVRAGNPPAMSPVQPLAAIAVLVAGIFAIDRSMRQSIARYRYLKRLLQG